MKSYNLFNIYNSLDRKLRRAYLIMFCLYESSILSLIVEEPEDRVPEDLGVYVDVVLPVLQIHSYRYVAGLDVVLPVLQTHSYRYVAGLDEIIPVLQKQ
jgi:hypothetical protein